MTTPEEARAALLASLTVERFTHVPQAPAGSCDDGPTALYLRQLALETAATIVDFPMPKTSTPRAGNSRRAG